MSEGLKISELSHYSGGFEQAIKDGAMLPVAIGETSNAKISAGDISQYISRALSGKAEAADLEALEIRVTQNESSIESWRTLFDNHNENEERHITQEERDTWNTKQDLLAAGDHQITLGDGSATPPTSSFRFGTGTAEGATPEANFEMYDSATFKATDNARLELYGGAKQMLADSAQLSMSQSSQLHMSSDASLLMHQNAKAFLTDNAQLLMHNSSILKTLHNTKTEIRGNLNDEYSSLPALPSADFYHIWICSSSNGPRTQGLIWGYGCSSIYALHISRASENENWSAAHGTWRKIIQEGASVDHAINATSAGKADNDGSGRNIVSTYALQNALPYQENVAYTAAGAPYTIPATFRLTYIRFPGANPGRLVMGAGYLSASQMITANSTWLTLGAAWRPKGNSVYFPATVANNMGFPSNENPNGRSGYINTDGALILRATSSYVIPNLGQVNLSFSYWVPD